MRLLSCLCFIIVTISLASCRRDKKGTIAAAKEKIVLMLDAAHGGADSGAVSEDGTLIEKERVLKMCTLMQVIAPPYNIEVRLLRTSDTTLSVSERVNIVNSQSPDLLLSLHVRKLNPPDPLANKFEAIVSPSSSDYGASKKASLAFLGRFSVSGRDTLLTERDIILQKSVSCPSIVLECGNVDNAANKALMKDDTQMEQLCREILAAAVDYANER